MVQKANEWFNELPVIWKVFAFLMAGVAGMLLGFSDRQEIKAQVEENTDSIVSVKNHILAGDRQILSKLDTINMDVVEQGHRICLLMLGEGSTMSQRDACLTGGE